MAWTVAEVMTRDVVTVTPHAEFKDCVDLLRIHGVSALPVVEADELLGIVTEFDLLLKEERRDDAGRRGFGRWADDRRAAGRVARDLMSTPVVCIRQGAYLAEAARLMHRRSVKRLVVVDEHGALAGIVSRADLLKPFLRSDESIRREVAEELVRKTLALDPKAVDVVVTEGVVRLEGQVETRSLGRLLERLVEGVEGVVAVDNALACSLNDEGLGVELPPQALQLSADERR